MASKQNPSKKPSGGRPIVRRLFSKESVASLGEIHTHTRSNDGKKAGGEPPLSIVKEISESQGGKPWTGQQLVSSPGTVSREATLFSDDSPSSSTPSSVNTSKPSLPLHAPTPKRHKHAKQSVDSLPRAATASPPLVSPSIFRWEQLRQHVLPSSSSILSSATTVATTAYPLTVTSPTPSFTSFSQIGVPTRTATPKPSRLARFGFRQVVAEARVIADDLTQRFGEDIQRACWAARFDEVLKLKVVSRMEREASHHPTALGSALHLPFKSSTSLPLTNNSSSSNLPTSGGGLKRPSSSLNLQQTSNSRANALLRLQGVIVQYASVSKQKETTYLYLPHEREVLSVLLIAFLSQSTGRIADDERRLSMEIFETIVRTWRTPQPDGEIDRCLWCCRAATMPASPMRSRVLLILTFLLTSREPLLTTPIAFRTVLPSMALLLPHFSGSSESESDFFLIRDLLSQSFEGKCGQLDLEDLEQKYNTIAMSTDSEEDIRRGMCVDALLRCLEVGTSEQQRIIYRTIEEYWPEPNLSIPFTPLRRKIHIGKINTFLRAAARLLHQLSHSEQPVEVSVDAGSILRILTYRVLPELDSMGDEVRESRRLAVKVALALACVDSAERFQAAEFLVGWLENSFWKNCVEEEAKNIADSADWPTVIKIATATLDVVPLDARKTLAGLMIPQLQERVVSDPPPHPCESLSHFLQELARIHPQVFYKPIFICAASTKEVVIAHQLTLLTSLNSYMPQLWTTDAEMIAVAIMSDTSGVGKGKGREGQRLGWGQARLGQHIILFEMIGALRNLRHAHKLPNAAIDESFGKVVKFATVLESRLSIWLAVKEQTCLIPLSQRCLLAALFLEIRLITRSLKSATWFQQVVSWVTCFHDPYDVPSNRAPVTEEVMEEYVITRHAVQSVLSSAKECSRPQKQRRSTVVMSPKLTTSTSGDPADPRDSIYESRINLVSSFSMTPICIFLELLVAVSGALKKEDYVQIGRELWEHCLESEDSKTLAYACFLVMQCAEKASSELLPLIHADLDSANTGKRTRALIRISVLSSWRFQLLSLSFITDRTHRRPFKLARPPIAFVPTDVGSANFVFVRDANDDVLGSKGSALPPDLRRRLTEIGWANEDEPIDQQLELLRTPVSLLASTQLDQLNKQTDLEGTQSPDANQRSPSPGATPTRSPKRDRGLLRRNSSTGGQYNIKRRPVFVQPLLTVFTKLATLALDNDFSMASLARDTLMDFMRDDPAVLCRPIFEILSGEGGKTETAVVTLRTFLQLRRSLPPRLSHHVFGHLAGFLKFLARESNSDEAFRELAHVVPSFAKFAPQVSELNIQAVRRAKLEVFLFPTGQLWFPDSAPQTAMFPRVLCEPKNPFEVPLSLVHITMIRISQNMLFVDLLKRNPQDVTFLRKSWSRVVLPEGEVSDSASSTLGAIAYVPERSAPHILSRRVGDAATISLSFARSHLLLVAQMFRSLTRHLNDRIELGVILDGVNRILIRHSDDIGIVGYALIVYMIASTRFRRLMASNSGFALFIPALLKVYCESYGNTAIRDAVEYAVHRFYAVHEETFLFQLSDAVASLMAHPGVEGDWLASSVYSLLSSLKGGPPSPDSAGIRDANNAQEEETALVITADETPQLFLASLKSEAKNHPEKLKNSLSSDIFNNKRFQPDNLVRLLLTVIGHDPTSQRAERFLRLLRNLTPHLYNASSSTRNVLRDGIGALGGILMSKTSGKVKTPDPAAAKAVTGGSEAETSNMDKHIPKFQFQNRSHNMPCDVQAMRTDYLMVVAAYVKSGGQVRYDTIRTSITVANVLLKESPNAKAVSDTVQTFINMVVEAFLSREDPKAATDTIKELMPIINLHGSVLNLNRLLNSLSTMSSNPLFANNELFSTVVVHQVCAAVLDLCEIAAEENLISSLPYHTSFVSLLSQAISLLGADAMLEIEKHKPSPPYLAGIILPFASTLRTTSELTVETQWTDSRRQDAHARAWVRLFSYTMRCCDSNGMCDRKDLSRSFSNGNAPVTRNEKSQRTSVCDSSSVARCAIAVITLKVIIVRGEEDISTMLPGSWLRLGSVLRALLSDGNAAFAIQRTSVSPMSSPIASPIARSFVETGRKSEEGLRHRRSSSSTSEKYLSITPHRDDHASRPSSPNSTVIQLSERLSSGPRAVDYLIWSFFEFISLRRSPLTLYLRTFMHERLIALHEALQTFGESNDTRKIVRKSLRPLSTVFSKPRLLSMMGGSPGVSPDVSPHLSPSDSSPFKTSASNISYLSLDGSGLAPLITHLPSGSPSGSLRRQIVHLGPNYRISTPPDVYTSPRSASGVTPDDIQDKDGGRSNRRSIEVREALRSSIITSLPLTMRTYERVRVVQACMGYRALLPLRGTGVSRSNSFNGLTGGNGTSSLAGIPMAANPQASMSSELESEPDVKAWTKGRAVSNAINEAREVLEAWQEQLAFVIALPRDQRRPESPSVTGSVEDLPSSGIIPSLAVGPTVGLGLQ